MKIDPLTLAVVRGGIEQIAEEMDITLKRTAFSPVIAEANDMANGFYHPKTGEVIAQGKWGLPTFIGVMQFTTEAVIKEAGRLGIEEGDEVALDEATRYAADSLTLDAENSEIILTHLSEFAGSGEGAVLMVTHDDRAKEAASRSLEMAEGKLVG